MGDDSDIATLFWIPSSDNILVGRMWRCYPSLVNTKTGENYGLFENIGSTVMCLAASVPGNWMLISDTDHYGIYLSRTLSPKPPDAFVAIEHDEIAYSLAASPDGNFMFIGEPDGVSVLNAQTLEKEAYLEFPYGDVYALCVTPDGKHLVAGGENGHIMVWERV
jgi:WD40 repeat protein